MRKIIDLEIKNLSQKEKEELLYDLSAETREIEQLKKEILHLKCKDQKKCKH